MKILNLTTGYISFDLHISTWRMCHILCNEAIFKQRLQYFAPHPRSPWTYKKIGFYEEAKNIASPVHHNPAFSPA